MTPGHSSVFRSSELWQAESCAHTTMGIQLSLDDVPRRADGRRVQWALDRSTAARQGLQPAIQNSDKTPLAVYGSARVSVGTAEVAEEIRPGQCQHWAA